MEVWKLCSSPHVLRTVSGEPLSVDKAALTPNLCADPTLFIDNAAAGGYLDTRRACANYSAMRDFTSIGLSRLEEEMQPKRRSLADAID